MIPNINQDVLTKIKEQAKPLVRYLQENNIEEFYIECSILGIGFRNAIRIIKPEEMPPYDYNIPASYRDEGFIPV